MSDAAGDAEAKLGRWIWDGDGDSAAGYPGNGGCWEGLAERGPEG